MQPKIKVYWLTYSKYFLTLVSVIRKNFLFCLDAQLVIIRILIDKHWIIFISLCYYAFAFVWSVI